MGADPTLASLVRDRTGEAWRAVKERIASGRVAVDGVVVTDPGARVAPGRSVELREQAQRRRRGAEVRIVHDDTHLVVVDKPEGVMSVPFDGERDTAMDLVRDAWKRQGRPSAPVLVVHRIDKDTSGLLCFAKTRRAQLELARMFREHVVGRTYLCVAHGDVAAARIESRLVDDRGDGLRGSTRRPGGKRSVTHVTPLARLEGATLCEVRLETGRTHQIRIHLAERGHPIVGETVYVRDLERAGGRPIDSPRLLLHAATLELAHPVSEARLSFRSEIPPDFAAIVERLGGSG